MSNEPLEPAAGQEVLVVDADAQIVKGLDRLLSRVGLMVTGTADPMRARDQLVNKFYAVALIDADNAAAMLELLQFVREKSPLTSVIVMTAQKTFDSAIAAFRAGAVDVVLKHPDTVPYLRQRVLSAAGELKALSDRNTLLEEVSEVHEEFFRRLRESSKQLVDMEDRILGRTPGTDGEIAETMNLLLVEDDASTVQSFQSVLGEASGWRVTAALTGGEALDIASQLRPQVMMVKELLPDLPGSMVVKTVKATAPDAITLLYSLSSRSGGAGELKMVESSRVFSLVAQFSRAEQIAEPLEEIREALRQKLRERRYLQAFRQRNFEFLQRYSMLKQRIGKALDKGKKS